MGKEELRKRGKKGRGKKGMNNKEEKEEVQDNMELNSESSSVNINETNQEA